MKTEDIQNHKGGRYWGMQTCTKEGSTEQELEGGILQQNVLDFYTVAMNDGEEEPRTHPSSCLGSL